MGGRGWPGGAAHDIETPPPAVRVEPGHDPRRRAFRVAWLPSAFTRGFNQMRH